MDPGFLEIPSFGNFQVPRFHGSCLWGVCGVKYFWVLPPWIQNPKSAWPDQQHLTVKNGETGGRSDAMTPEALVKLDGDEK